VALAHPQTPRGRRLVEADAPRRRIGGSVVALDAAAGKTKSPAANRLLWWRWISSVSTPPPARFRSSTSVAAGDGTAGAGLTDTRAV